MGLCGAYGSVNGMTAINSKAASDGRHLGSAVHTIHAEIDETRAKPRHLGRRLRGP